MKKTITRNKFADFLNTGTSDSPVWSFMGTGFNTLNEQPQAQTDEKTYVNETSSSTTVKGYKPQYPFDTDLMVDGDAATAAIEKLYDTGRNRLTGSDAETEYVRVEMFRPATPGSERYFKARKETVAIIVSNVNGNGGETIVVSGNLNAVGDHIDGYWDTVSQKFTPGEYTETLEALTVTSVAGSTSGTTKITVTPTLTSGNLYMYKTASTVTAPNLNDDCSAGYTVWNGSNDITALTGNQILIVECNTSFKVKKAGIATVAAKA
jgi:hypothetical protein